MKATAYSKNFLLLALIAGALSGATYAQDDLFDETQDVLNSDQIDLEGTYRKKTQADRLANMRKKLEKQNEQMVQKKIEDMRMDEEKKLTNKLRSAFTGQLPDGGQDQVSVVQAATQKVVAPVVEEKKAAGIKILPYFGVASIQGDNLDLESKLNTGLSVEAMVSKNFSVGVGFNYMNLKATDYGQNNSGGIYGQSTFQNPNSYPCSPIYGCQTSYNPYNTFNNPGYSPYNGNPLTSPWQFPARELDYSQVTLEINSKFFMFPEARIRPYLGLGVSYNRTSLKYTQDEQFQNQYQSYTSLYGLGEEKYSSSYVGAAVMLGSEIHFTDNFGLNLDLKYSRGLTSGFSNKSANLNNNLDQQRLERVGKAIEDSSIFALTGGILISF